MIVSGLSPFPCDSGGATRIYNTIKQLSKSFDIYLIFFKNNNYFLEKNEIDFLKKNTKLFHIITLPEEKRYDLFLSHSIPYWFSNWFSQELILIINTIVKQYHIKIVQVEPSQLAYLVDFLPKNTKTIIVAYDINTISFYRRMGELTDIKTRILHFFLWFQIVWYEIKFLKKYNILVTMSNHDKNIAAKLFHPQKTLSVPNGINEIDFATNINKLPLIIRLGYIGSFNHPPNKCAFIYFVTKIAPLLEKYCPNYTFTIVGNNNPKEIRSIVFTSSLKKKKRIKQAGFIKYLKDFYTNIDLLIVPLLVGSGTRLKILESLGFGTPVLTTPIGAEGIENINRDFLTICKNPEEFVKAIREHLSNPEKTSEKSALRNSLSPYLWSNIFKNYHQLLGF